MKKVEIVDIDDLQELLLSFAEGDYSKRLPVSDTRGERDTLVAGINMLGEELQDRTVSKDYFESIYNAISDLVVVTDSKGVITSVNKASIEMLQNGSDSLIGVSVFDVFESPKATLELKWVVSGEKDMSSFEQIQVHGESKKYLSCTITRIESKYKSHEGFLVIVKDLTHEKVLEGEVLNAIIDTEEKERNRLANDLHDALGQELNSVKMMFDSLLLMNAQTLQYKEVMEICRNVINDCIDNTRLLSYDLMPKTLDDEFLFNAFEELVAKNKELLLIDLYLPEEEYNISKKKKINIYRVIQEFITNSLKHSGAKTLEIRSYVKDDRFYFSISDDGEGFDSSKNVKGRGLKNIQSRLKAIDADFQLESGKSKGTSLKFSFK